VWSKPVVQIWSFGRIEFRHSWPRVGERKADSTSLEYTSPESSSAYEPPSSPPDSPTAAAARRDCERCCTPDGAQLALDLVGTRRAAAAVGESGGDDGGASAKLHPPHLPKEQVVNRTLGIIKATMPRIAMLNFARNILVQLCF
jgi:hypothetical protein